MSKISLIKMGTKQIMILKMAPVLTGFLCLSLVSCSSVRDSFPSYEDSIDKEIALRTWNDQELLAQNLFLHTILPELELPKNAVVSYTKSTGMHTAECYFQVMFGLENTAVCDSITSIFDRTYGIHEEVEGFIQWHVNIEGEEFFLTIQLNTQFGYFVATPHANTWRGCKEYLDVYFAHFYEGEKFDDLYPLFPSAIKDCEVSFYDGGALERAYVVIVLDNYNLHESWEIKRRVGEAGWHVYPWTKEGVENTKVYTKEGVSGGLMYDLSEISKNKFLIHMSAGFESIDYSVL
ncbi:MAG: hypothetical protein WC366_02940 [Bacilli bacterium]